MNIEFTWIIEGLALNLRKPIHRIDRHAPVQVFRRRCDSQDKNLQLPIRVSDSVGLQKNLEHSVTWITFTPVELNQFTLQ